MTAVLTVGGAAPAMAAESASSSTSGAMPPVALPDCVTPPGAGGWDNRDFTVVGTSGLDEEYPVRPLIARLGEPCVVDGELRFVMSADAIPLDPIDADEDGYDDPLP